MTGKREEIYLWEDLLHSVNEVLGMIGDSRSQVKDRWDDPTPSFDRAEHLMAEVYDFIDGRIQELDPYYSERTACGSKAKAQARKALSYGINYQAFKGIPYEETDRALSFIEGHGLSSMNYEATRQAILQFWEAELEANRTRVIVKEGVKKWD